LLSHSFFFIFTDLGINQGIIKFTANLNSKGETDRITKIIKHGLLLRAATGIIIFIINYAFADLFASLLLQRPELAFYVRIASISVLFQVILTTGTSAFVGLDKTEYNALTTNIQAIAKTIISVTLVLLGFALTGAIMGYVASYIVAAITGIAILSIMLRGKQNIKNSHSLAENAKILIHYGAPLYISILLTGFIPLYKNVILAFFTTDAEIGNYKAATNFATLITVLSLPITTVLLPAFSKLNSEANHKIRTFFKLANKYTTMIVIPVTFLIIIFSNEIVQIIYGTTYQSAPLFLATYCLLYLLTGLGYLTLTSLYNGLGETKTTLKMSIITFILLAILSPILTQTYNVQGVITAFLIANTAGTLYGSYIARKKFQIKFDTSPLLKIYSISIVSSILPLIIVNFTHLPSLFTITIGGLLYLFTYTSLIPITKTVTTLELQKAASITQNVRLLDFIAKPILKYEQKMLHIRSNSKKLVENR